MLLAEQITLDRASEDGLVRQLFAQIRRLIEEGRLPAEAHLPPSRQLALALGVGRNSVLAAYEQLAMEGYVHPDGRRGTKVSKASAGFAEVGGGVDASPVLRTAPRLSEQATRVMAIGRRDMPGPVAFQPGMPETRAFPHDLWARLLRRAARGLHGRQDLAGYGHYAGLPDLKQAIAAHVAKARGVVAGADQVMIFSSAQAAMDLVARVLLNRGDCALHEEPGYGGMLAALSGVGADIRPIQVDEPDAYRTLEAVVLDDATPRLVYVTPSHQYPTGRVMPLDERLALLDFAASYDAFILEDDYDSEFHFSGAPISCLQGLDRRDLVIYMGTFSKALMPSLHVAYLIVPKRLKDPVRRVLRNIGAVPPLVVQMAPLRFPYRRPCPCSYPGYGQAL